MYLFHDSYGRLMATIILPVSSVDPGVVKRYLASTGESEAVVEWKYFDQRFGQGRERGFVLIGDGEAHGFIGLIPFRMLLNRREVSVAWSCDLSIDLHSHTLLNGLRLLRECFHPYDFVLSSANGASARQMFSQIARVSIPYAVVTLHAFIPIAPLFPALKLLKPELRHQVVRSLYPLPRLLPSWTGGREVADDNVMIEPGVSRVLARLLDRLNVVDRVPLYDLEYIEWQIGRCPVLASHTVYFKAEDNVGTAILLWCSAASRDFWRMSVLAVNPKAAEVRALITATLAYVLNQGGVSLSVVVSRKEGQLIEVLRKCGFIVSPKRRPLYVMGASRLQHSLPEPRRLSFLDTDLGYRMPANYPTLVSTAANDMGGG
jgi:hypothetical protein